MLRAVRGLRDKRYSLKRYSQVASEGRRPFCIRAFYGNCVLERLNDRRDPVFLEVVVACDDRKFHFERRCDDETVSRVAVM